MQSLKRISCLLLVVVMLFTMVVATTLTTSAATPLKHLVQWESKWKYYIGGGTLYNTGCGIFSMRNAIGYLTGYDIGIDAPARWAHSIGAYNVTGGEGTYRLVLYPKITAKYGAKAGFKVINSSVWSGASNSTLKSHLANGGVAIGHVPGHFIAIVDYNYNTNKFHVLDSAPSSSRGTSSNYGDCWVTQSRLSTGKLKLDWFCLLSATGTPADEQVQVSAEKTSLGKALETARGKYYFNYSASNIGAFRTAYDEALAVYNKSGSTDSQYKSARTKLETAMNASAYTVLSKGKSYTVKNTTNTGDYADDTKKLTDGSKGNLDGGTNKFVGFNNGEIVVDLGSAQNANIFKIYMTAGDWGIEIPKANELKMSVSVSTNGTTYTPVNTTNTFYKSGIKTGAWEALTLTANTDTAVSARYVKFNVSSDAPNNYVWLDEVEVANGDPLLSGQVYLNGANGKIGAGDSFLYTSGFGEVNVSNANISWTCNVVAKWDDAKGGFVVKSNTAGTGANTPSIKLADDEILIAAHNWESGVTDGTAVAGSEANFATLYSLKVGDVITLDGVKIGQTLDLSVAAYVRVQNQSSTQTPDSHTHVPGEVTCMGGQSCLTCGALVAEPLGHDQGEWVTIENYEQRVCTKCDEVLEIKGDALKGVENIDKNVATDKKYSTSLPYAQGDASNDWGFVEGKEPDYPDENGSSLTDGLVPSSGDFYNEAWVGLHYNTPDAAEKGYSWITIDLGEVYDINKIVLYGANDTLGEGVSTMKTVKFFNAETDEELGDAVVTSYNDVTNAYTLTGDFTAKVIEARIVHYGWHFVAELAVEGVVYTEKDETSSVTPDVSEETSEEDVSKEESTENKPSENKPSENKPSENKPSENKPSNDETSKDETNEPLKEIIGKFGDINYNEAVDMTDYILLKRAYFGTFVLDEAQMVLGDINENGDIDMTDYILLKRIYFGTFNLKEPIAYK